MISLILLLAVNETFELFTLLSTLVMPNHSGGGKSIAFGVVKFPNISSTSMGFCPRLHYKSGTGC